MNGENGQAGSAASCKTRRAFARVRFRLLVSLGILCLTAALGYQLWQLWRSQYAAPPVADWSDSFEGAAFAPGATSLQLTEESKRVARETLDAFPEDPEAINVVARWEYVSGDHQSAIGRWEKVLELDPNFTEALYALAVIAVDNDEVERAIPLLERLRLLDRVDVRVPVILAEAYSEAGRQEEAQSLLERHIRSGPTSAEALVALADIYLRQRQYSQAIEHYQTAIRNFPGMRPAYYGLGQAYARMGEREKAEEAMGTFEALAQEQLETQSESARGFLDSENAKQAAAQIHHDAAAVYALRNRWDKAEELARKAVFLDPDNTEYWSHLLTFYERTQQSRKALQVARELVRLNPRDANFWLNVAFFAARADQPEEALAAVDKAIELEPDNPRCQEAYDLVRAAAQ